MGRDAHRARQRLGVPILRNKTAAWDTEENREPRIRSYEYPNREREEPIGKCMGWLCPANPNRTEQGTLGLTHYVGLAGLGPDAASRPAHDPLAGIFGYDRRTRREDIKNGVSNTLLVIETAAVNGPWTAGGPATVRGFTPVLIPFLGPGGQFGSRHSPQVTNAAFADASVRSLTESIDPGVLQAAVSVGGQDVVGCDW
jgi:hypothetical protein